MAKTKTMARKAAAESGDTPVLYQLRITLVHSKPPIWRRLVAPASLTLDRMHWAIQLAFGWTNSHLHQFVDVSGTYYSDPAFQVEATGDETKVRLDALLKKPKDRVLYEYDFGDSWEHLVVLEKILPALEPKPKVLCVAGKRACPPEDIGGIWGYEEFLQAMADEEHDRHDDMVEWSGMDDWDAEAFDIEQVNKLLRKV